MPGDKGDAAATRLHERGRSKIAALVGLILLSGCDGGLSEAQLSYDACVDAYNNTFRSLPGNKAMVSGVTGGTTQCFWVWSSASIEAAQSAALANCQEKQARCFVFATDAGLSTWAAQISSNGGVDPGNGGGGWSGGGSGTASGDDGSGNDGGGMSFGDFLDLGNAILGGFAAGMGAGGGGVGVGGGHVGGGGGTRSSGANAGQCQQYLNLAQQCRQRQQTMNSVGSNGLGTSGQAGSFNDCYNMYMNLYNAQCR